jgi:hypothetical protein
MVSPNQPSVRRVFDDVLQKIRVDIARGASRAASTPETHVEGNRLIHETIAQAAGNLYL